jgi:hypothetical protein
MLPVNFLLRRLVNNFSCINNVVGSLGRTVVELLTARLHLQYTLSIITSQLHCFLVFFSYAMHREAEHPSSTHA